MIPSNTTISSRGIPNYRPRIVDNELAARMRATGGVLIEGPRGCGKTQTALRIARSAVRVDRDQAARAAGLIDPTLLLEGERPRLIDEWQLVPEVWNAARGVIDDEPEQTGQFIFTGSAAPADDTTRHTGSLRFTRLRMRPMSLTEGGHSTGGISIAALFDGTSARATDPGLDIRRLADLISIGGWPALLGREPADALAATQGYLDEARRVDLQRLDGVRRDPENVARVLRSLARHTSTEASARAMASDIGGPNEPIKYQTVLEYIDALTRIFVVEQQPAWSPSLRSRSVLRSAPKHHFVDPSLAVAAMGASPSRLLKDPETLGLLFESLVVRDLRIYAQPIGGSVLHYRESNGLEADAIIQLRDGRWAALEVKLGPGAVDSAAASLRRVRDRIDPAVHGEPSFLAVITGWGISYRRDDGVLVVPVGVLGA
jgi:predicted AAA+ superfamily ATPase